MNETHEEVSRSASTTAQEPDALAKAIGYGIFLVPLYHFLVWKNLPEPEWVRWALTAAVLALVVIAYIVSKAQTVAAFKTAGRILTVLLIVSGAVVVSVTLSADAQQRVFRLFVVLFFSLLPAWLYLHFIYSKGQTQWDEYVLNLFRLHVDHYAHLPEPPRQSIFHEEWLGAKNRKPSSAQDSTASASVYRKKFESLFGHIEPGIAGIGILRGENLWPVAIATLLISVGWVLVAQPVSIAGPATTVQAATPVAFPLQPLGFAFLGAYFYILQMLVRRYFQNDLKTGAYLNATLRIIIAAFLVITLDMLLGSDVSPSQRAAMAFVIGVFPNTGWQLLTTLIKLPLRQVMPNLRQKYPLSDLDGLNTWYESRLLEEGIEDMQNLATTSIVDAMLNTRIPVDRLVDWIDQSLLYLHIAKPGNERNGTSDRDILRQFGIRTATDLCDLLECEDNELVAKAERLLTKDASEPSRLRVIQVALRNEPNLYHVRKWKGFANDTLAPLSQ